MFIIHEATNLPSYFLNSFFFCFCFLFGVSGESDGQFSTSWPRIQRNDGRAEEGAGRCHGAKATKFKQKIQTEKKF